MLLAVAKVTQKHLDGGEGFRHVLSAAVKLGLQVFIGMQVIERNPLDESRHYARRHGLCSGGAWQRNAADR
jgi:hypothetical protein